MAGSITLPSWLASVPSTTRYLLLLLLSESLLLAGLRYAASTTTDYRAVLRAGYDSTLAFPWMVLVPGYAFYYPWTLLTSSFAEANLLEFITSGLALGLCGGYFEKFWGATEFLKFVGVVTVASNVIAVGANILESWILRNAGFLYDMNYHGLTGLQSGILVAYAQLLPEHSVMLFGGFLKLRVKQLPTLYMLFSNIMMILGYQSPYLLIQLGFVVAWFYLRFIKRNDAGERGDRSDTFAFQTWFPPFLQKPIGIVGDHLFDLMVRAKIVRPWTPMDLESGGFGSGANGPGGARAEAERRRAMALKALDQRLATKSSRSQQPGPSAPTSQPQSQQSEEAPKATLENTPAPTSEA